MKKFFSLYFRTRWGTAQITVHPTEADRARLLSRLMGLESDELEEVTAAIDAGDCEKALRLIGNFSADSGHEFTTGDHDVSEIAAGAASVPA